MHEILFLTIETLEINDLLSKTDNILSIHRLIRTLKLNFELSGHRVSIPALYRLLQIELGHWPHDHEEYIRCTQIVDEVDKILKIVDIIKKNVLSFAALSFYKEMLTYYSEIYKLKTPQFCVANMINIQREVWDGQTLITAEQKQAIADRTRYNANLKLDSMTRERIGGLVYWSFHKNIDFVTSARKSAVDRFKANPTPLWAPIIREWFDESELTQKPIVDDVVFDRVTSVVNAILQYQEMFYKKETALLLKYAEEKDFPSAWNLFVKCGQSSAARHFGLPLIFHLTILELM